MPAHPRLHGRRRECATLDRLLERLRAGESGVVVMRGEQGVGKSALLEYLVQRSNGCRVLRAAGVEAEMELAYAGLHQLVAPLLDRLDRLPAPQQAALSTAFGFTDGPPPARFLIGLAVLNLLSDASGERPLVCVVDDVQWLDRGSAQALAFVGRRLQADAVVLAFAARDVDDGGELAGLPVLAVNGLQAADARALLGTVFAGPFDERVAARLVAETRGNPLALLELPRGLTTTDLAGGFGVPSGRPLAGRIQESFRRRVDALSDETRRMLLIAAAEPLGDPQLLWAAARRLGLEPGAMAPAEADGLVTVAKTVTFHHTLVRSAIYRAAPDDERRAAHQALADVTDPVLDPDRRVWHRAHAAPGPDEDVAGELERSAGRARARGGLLAAAAFLERAATLTPDPGHRARRGLAAAQLLHVSGASAAALRVLDASEITQLDELDRARAELLQAQIAVAQRRGAAPLLLRAARALAPLDDGLARETYLEAMVAADFAFPLAGSPGVGDVAHAARQIPAPSGAARPVDLLLEGMAVRALEGYPAAVPLLKQALQAFRTDQVTDETGLRWIWAAYRNAVDLWDDAAWDEMSARYLEVARSTGALSALPMCLNARLGILVRAGDYATASAMNEEVRTIAAATGNHFSPYSMLLLTLWRGDTEEFDQLVDEMTDEFVARGEGQWLTVVSWGKSLLYNCLDRPADALRAAAELPADGEVQIFSAWTLLEVVEAAANLGAHQQAAAAFEQLTEYTTAAGTDWSLGVEARCRALISTDEAAEHWYRVAIERLQRTLIRNQEGRAHLNYGDWLRGRGRDREAIEEFRIAHELFQRVHATALTERAAERLAAVGERVTRPAGATMPELTTQEAQIARLARAGGSNAAIGEQLFISPRTVEWHLRNVFNKLGISSRRELATTLVDH